MKKNAVIVIFMISFINVFAMGFRDTYWGMSLSDLQKDKNIYYVENDNENILGTEYKERGRITGISTEISYFLKNDRLKAGGYSLPYSQDKANELLNKLTKKYGDPFQSVSKGIFDKEAFKSSDENRKKELNEFLKMPPTNATYEDIYFYYHGGGSLFEDWIADKEKIEKTENQGGFYVFNDENTDIYFIAGIFPDVMTVIYTEHEDDF